MDFVMVKLYEILAYKIHLHLMTKLYKALCMLDQYCLHLTLPYIEILDVIPSQPFGRLIVSLFDYSINVTFVDNKLDV